jgi:antagonist of KipI
MANMLEVVNPGPLSMLQDLGRPGWMKYGVPPSGALDQEALTIANLLAGNPEGAAGIEITYGNFTARALAPTVLACAGAWAPVHVDGVSVPPWAAFSASPGQIVSIGAPTWGVRVYLAVRGGIAAPLVMGSASTYIRGALGGIDGQGRALRAGDLIATPDPPASVSGATAPACSVTARAVAALAKRQAVFEIAHSPESARASTSASAGCAIAIRVVMGPQDDHFTEAGRQTFAGEEFTLTNKADRMGLRFDGPAIEHVRGADIISDGMPPGAIQVPGDGAPIVMLADRQTTGGYPKIACVARADLDLLAHLRPGDRVRFVPLSAQDAHEALKQEQAASRVPGRALRIAIDGVEHVVALFELQ